MFNKNKKVAEATADDTNVMAEISVEECLVPEETPDVEVDVEVTVESQKTIYAVLAAKTTMKRVARAVAEKLNKHGFECTRIFYDDALFYVLVGISEDDEETAQLIAKRVNEFGIPTDIYNYVPGREVPV